MNVMMLSSFIYPLLCLLAASVSIPFFVAAAEITTDDLYSRLYAKINPATTRLQR